MTVLNSGSTETKPSRRDAIRMLGAGCLAGAATVALGGSTVAAQAGDDEGDAIDATGSFTAVGTVIATSERDLTLATHSTTLVATPLPGARMYSGVSGRVASPSQFIVGDRVAVSGIRVEGGVVASSVGSVYQPLELVVHSVDTAASLAETSVGVVDFGGALPDLGRIDHALQVGVTLRGLSWTDPRNGQVNLVLTEGDRVA